MHKIKFFTVLTKIKGIAAEGFRGQYFQLRYITAIHTMVRMKLCKSLCYSLYF